LAERRKYSRIPSEGLVYVRLLDEDAEREVASLKVLGMGGLMFRSERTFGEGSFVDLFAQVGGNLMHMQGRVAYERRDDDDGIDVGVGFLRLGMHAREALIWAVEGNSDGGAAGTAFVPSA